jgi:hypothetical protein
MNENRRSPQEKPPHPPSQDASHTHPQQRWNTHGEQQSWFKILPPDGTQEESILANNIPHINKKGKIQKKDKPLIYVPKKTPQHISTQIRSEHAKKFIAIYIIQQKETSSAWAAAEKTRWQESNFMKLVISIWW